LRYTIRLEKTVQEEQFQPFRAEFSHEYDSEYWEYGKAAEHSLEQLERIFAARKAKVEERKNNKSQKG
jgi:hypothetical protein